MKTLTLEKIKKSVEQVAKEYDVKTVSLFGSYASGRGSRASDIDLLVEFGPVSLLDVIGFTQDIEDLIGKKVDVITAPIPKDSFLVIDKEIRLYENF